MNSYTQEEADKHAVLPTTDGLTVAVPDGALLVAVLPVMHQSSLFSGRKHYVK